MQGTVGEYGIWITIFPSGAAGPDPSTVYVDTRALRNDRVTLVGKGAPHSLALLESGKVGREIGDAGV